MAAEEDKRFDAVLGAFLVNDLRIRAGDFHCPESDTLAAYHERLLLPEEMNSWKEHIGGCARCQAILAELDATDSIPVPIAEKEEVLAGVAREPAAAGESIPPQEEAPQALQEKPRVMPMARQLRWRWLVPAAAVAAGLLVWVAWHENGALQVKTTEVTTAKMEPPATLPPSVARDDRQSVPAEEVARTSKDQDAVSGTVPAKSAPEAKSLTQFEKPVSRGRLGRSKPLVDKETGARAAPPLDSLSSANRAQNQDAKAGVAGAMSETVEVQTPTANAQLQNQQVQQNQFSQREISGPHPSKHLEKTKKSKSESPPLEYRAAAATPVPPPGPVPSVFNDNAALRMASAVSPYVISAPDKKTLWRVGHLGMIELSTDGGISWSPQISNASVDLTAGSAPSDKVCWVVGRAGTILVTTDAGSYWSVVHSPLDQEDLGGVRATDARHATIWNLANTKILETSDAGVTWKPTQAP